MSRCTSCFRFDRLESRRLLSAVLRVDVNSTAPQPDGSSWPNAFTDLQQALAVATAGDQIWMADGTYRPTTGTDRTISFELKDAVSIYGGYAGIGAINPDLRDVSQFVTTLSGNIGAPDSTTDNSFHVLKGLGSIESPLTSSTIIDGFTIRDGYSNDIDLGTSGAGMVLDNATPRISHCTFMNNAFMGGGGGLAVFNRPNVGEPLLPPISISDCSFVGNFFLDIPGFYISGGGLYTAGNAVVERCYFQGNSAALGGGLAVESGQLTVRDCEFVRNSAIAGGAINLEPSDVTIIGSRFNGNRAQMGGAIRAKATAAQQIVNCSFVGNRADEQPDGSFHRGGAICVTSGSGLVVTNCDIIANSAAFASGGIEAPSNGSTVRNSTVRDNVAPSSPQLRSVGASDSNIEGTYSGTNIVDADPKFVRDPSPGADNTWGTPDDDYGDLRLQITSPNIDAGNNASVPPGVSTDINGRPRFFDFPGVNDGAGAVVDIGANELDLHLGLLRVASGQTLALPAGGHTFFVEQLDVQPDATLDVRDDSLIVDYTGASQLAAIQSLINTGRTAGAWTGTGITSSTAGTNPLHNTTLGAIEASEFKSIYSPTALFGGHTIDDSAVLVKYTYYGDTDFNGVLDFDDYSRIDAGFNANESGWLNGDVDGNGVVDFDDYSLIDQAFNTQSSTLRTSGRHLGRAGKLIAAPGLKG